MRLRELIVVGLLFILALALRVWGITFGLPYLYHPDEPAFVLQALAIGRGLPNGVTFANPPLDKYLLLIEYAATYAVGRVNHIYASPQDFVNQFRADPTRLYLIARVTSALFGAATVIVVYALAARVRGRRVALLAAALAAFAYLLVRESHFAVNDALVTFLTTLALYFSLRILQQSNRRDYIVAGALVGLAFAAKYTGAVALVPLVLAHFWSPARRWKNLLLALGAALGAVVIGFPSVFLETHRVVGDVYAGLYSKGQFIGYDGLDPAGGYIYYFKVLLWGLGAPLFLFGIGGIILAVARRERALLIVAALPLALYASMGYERMYFARYLLPAVPALIILAAVAVDAAIQSLAARWKFSTGVAYLAAALLIGLLPFLDSIRFDVIMTQADTRTQASEWIQARLPLVAKIATDWPPFGPTISNRDNLLVANGWSLFDLTIEDYHARGVDYVVASSYTYDMWLLDPAKDARRREFYDRLNRGVHLIAEFKPDAGDGELHFVYDQIYAPFTELNRLQRPGPTIRIYDLRNDGIGSSR